MIRPYPLSPFLDGLRFITEDGIQYFVLIREEQERFFSDLPELSGFIFSIAFFPLNEQDIQSRLPDERIAATIAAVIKRLLTNQQNAVIFIVDHSDERHEARFRKFRTWYTAYATSDTEVFVSAIPLRDRNVMSGLILSSYHPAKEKLVYHFMRLAQRFAK